MDARLNLIARTALSADNAISSPMPYPFENNPLDSYLLKHRQLKTREFVLRAEFLEKRKMGENTKDIYQSLVSVGEQVLELKKTVPIAPRVFDTFSSDRDLKIKAFHQENPKPEKKVCLHTITEKRLQRHCNDSQHIATQCLTCGVILEHHSKEANSNWESFTEVDIKLNETFNWALTKWYGKKEALFDELPPAIEMPEFDAAQFKERYLELHPMPIDPSDCLHSATQLTFRIYKNGDSAAVNQCVDCGKHRSTVVKRSVPNIQSLPAFDAEKEPHNYAAISEWRSVHASALLAAKRKFNEERDRKIENGEIDVIDSTTFGTYYDSTEWVNTRVRIMERDSHTCQVEACNSHSECVHHITYDRLGCENDLDLISLCTECHLLIHRIQDASPLKARLTSCEIRNLPKGI